MQTSDSAGKKFETHPSRGAIDKHCYRLPFVATGRYPPCECEPHFAGLYCEWTQLVATAHLADVISSLTAEEQESVKQFVAFLKRKDLPSFLAAVEEFIGQHPELLRRLAS